VGTPAACVVALLLLCAGCTKKEPRGPGRIVTLDTDVVGLSGLTVDEHEAFWAPGEEGEAVIRIDATHFGVTRYPVVGVPSGTDLEAMAWIEGTRFVLGTETQEKGRFRDVILEGRLHGARFEVAPVGDLEYTRWNLTAPDNRGIEGICQSDGVLALATELVEPEGGHRWAPVGIYDRNTQIWTAHRVRLTSKTGKIAAMSCKVIDRSIIAIAVERHFGVSRLLRFEIPKGPEAQWIEPTLIADLSELFSPLPNFEGLAWLKDGSVVVVEDNRYRGAARNPSRLYFIPASAMK
jgi:hypothetical protein